MSKVLLAFLLSIGSSAWVYAKLSYKNGGQVKQALIATTVIAVSAFVVFLLILNAILK